MFLWYSHFSAISLRVLRAPHKCHFRNISQDSLQLDPTTYFQHKEMILCPLGVRVGGLAFINIKYFHMSKSNCASHSVMSSSLWPHGLQPTRLLYPWNSPGKNIGVDSHSLLQRIYSTRGLNLGLLIAGIFFIAWATREAQQLISNTQKWFYVLLEGGKWAFINIKYFHSCM